MKKKYLKLFCLTAFIGVSFSVSATLLSKSNDVAVVKASLEAGKDSYWNSWINANSATINSGGVSFANILHDKIDVDTGSYNGLWAAYKTTDVVPGYESDSDSNKKIWDMYGGYFFTYQSGGKNYSQAGDCYNREHSIPNSWWGGTTSADQYTDIHCLVPTDGKINQVRSNYMFGEVNSASSSYLIPERKNKSGTEVIQVGGEYSKLGSSKAIGNVSCPAGTVFEPADQYKGDFARIYMYFAIRYNGDAQSTSEGRNTFTTSFPYVTNYTLAMFKKWHVQDPVSQKEISRNNAAEVYQGNRNPFVDYPEWADKIFGTNYAGGGEETLTAKDWANDFISQTGAVCQNDGSTNYDSLSSVWNDVSESYKTLDSTQKSYITNPDSGPDTLTKHYAKIAKERYDFIVGKYEELEKFMTPTSPSLSVIDTQQDYSFIFVLVVSSIVISGLFITRLIYKKKTR